MRALIIAALLVIASPALAETIKKGMPICLEEDLFDTFLQAADKDDIPTLHYMLEQQVCFMTSRRQNVTVVAESGIAVRIVFTNTSGAELGVWTGKRALE
jgi:hypothetical protein